MTYVASRESAVTDTKSNQLVASFAAQIALAETAKAAHPRVVKKLATVKYDQAAADNYLPAHGHLNHAQAKAKLEQARSPMERADALHSSASLHQATLSVVSHNGSFDHLDRLHVPAQSNAVRKRLLNPQYMGRRGMTTWEHLSSEALTYQLHWLGAEHNKTPVISMKRTLAHAVEKGVQLRRDGHTGAFVANRDLELSFHTFMAVDPTTAALLEPEEPSGVLGLEVARDIGELIAVQDAAEIAPIATGLVAVQSFINMRQTHR